MLIGEHPAAEALGDQRERVAARLLRLGTRDVRAERAGQRVVRALLGDQRVEVEQLATGQRIERDRIGAVLRELVDRRADDLVAHHAVSGQRELRTEVVTERSRVEADQRVVQRGHRLVGRGALHLQLIAALQAAGRDEPCGPVGFELEVSRGVGDLRREHGQLGGLRGVMGIAVALRDAEPGKAEKSGERHRQDGNELPTNLHRM